MNPSDISLVDRYHQLLASIAQTAKESHRNPSEITLVAVSKGYPLSDVIVLYDQGQKIFAENRVLEGCGKISEAEAIGYIDIEWHFIGSLQKNKVQKVLPHFSMIHSVDSFELAKRISDGCVKDAKNTKILLQINTSGESTKHGLAATSCDLAIEEILYLPGISVEGLMTMAPLTEDKKVVSDCFKKLRLIKDRLQKRFGTHTFPHLSMGMSHDFKIAIAEGATILRIGSALFK